MSHYVCHALSGGVSQRVKSDTELSHQAIGKTLYILDDPITGLHFAQGRKLSASGGAGAKHGYPLAARKLAVLYNLHPKLPEDYIKKYLQMPYPVHANHSR